MLSEIEQTLIDQYQKGFPTTPRPFKTVADSLDSSEEEIIATLNSLQQRNILTRVGPVFDHRKAGASILVAMAVPQERIDHIAEQINQFAAVNHNYAREHYFNLWFVVTGSDKNALGRTIDEIEEVTGHKVLRLPMERSFHIDLGFKIDWSRHP